MRQHRSGSAFAVVPGHFEQFETTGPVKLGQPQVLLVAREVTDTAPAGIASRDRQPAGWSGFCWH